MHAERGEQRPMKYEKEMNKETAKGAMWWETEARPKHSCGDKKGQRCWSWALRIRKDILQMHHTLCTGYGVCDEASEEQE